MSILKRIFNVPTFFGSLLLTSSKKNCLWDYNILSSKIVPNIDCLFSKLDKIPSVQCRQLYRENSKEVNFGEIEWSESGHKKWSHNSEMTRNEYLNWIFVDVMLFSPKKSDLIRKNEVPELFIQIKPMVHEGIPSRTNYDQALFLLIRQDILRINKRHFETCISKIIDSVNPIGVYETYLRISSLNMFESLIRDEFMYKGILDDDLPDMTKMRKKWIKKV